MTPTSSAQELRAELMSCEAFTRVKALHALECAATTATPALARDLEEFVSRGIPFYSADDAHYAEWVNKAVAYWEKLHRPSARVRALKPAAPARGDLAHAQAA